ARVGQRVGRIDGDRLLKEFDALLESLGGALVPVITALQITPIGFGMLGVWSAEPALLLPRQTQAQFPGNLLGDGLLDGPEVRQLLAVVLAPELGTIRSVDELHLDDQTLVAL